MTKQSITRKGLIEGVGLEIIYQGLFIIGYRFIDGKSINTDVTCCKTNHIKSRTPSVNKTGYLVQGLSKLATFPTLQLGALKLQPCPL